MDSLYRVRRVRKKNQGTQNSENLENCPWEIIKILSKFLFPGGKNLIFPTMRVLSTITITIMHGAAQSKRADYWDQVVLLKEGGGDQTDRRIWSVDLTQAQACFWPPGLCQGHHPHHHPKRQLCSAGGQTCIRMLLSFGILSSESRWKMWADDGQRNSWKVSGFLPGTVKQQPVVFLQPWYWWWQLQLQPERTGQKLLCQEEEITKSIETRGKKERTKEAGSNKGWRRTCKSVWTVDQLWWSPNVISVEQFTILKKNWMPTTRVITKPCLLLKRNAAWHLLVSDNCLQFTCKGTKKSFLNKKVPLLPLLLLQRLLLHGSVEWLLATLRLSPMKLTWWFIIIWTMTNAFVRDAQHCVPGKDVIHIK